MSEVQIPVRELPHGPYSSRLREWSPYYSAVLTTERDSDTDFRYVVVSSTVSGAITGSLSDLLGVSPQVVLDYLDEQVVQGWNPPGTKLISRWYYTCTVGVDELYVVPWQYLYRIVEDLGAVAPV